MLFDAGAGLLLGLFCWIGYAQLSIVDPFQAYGVGGQVVFMLAGAVMYRTRARDILWATAGGIGFMILLVSYTPIVRSEAQALIRSDRVGDVDAVVVLSSSLSNDELLDQQGTDRLLTALELVKTKGAKALIVTGLAMKGSENELYSVHDQQRLFRLSEARVELISTPPVVNTRNEAVQSAAIARRRGWTKVALVTSPFHTRRACATFEKQGLLVYCVPALSRDVASRTLRNGSDRLRAFQLWLYESLAMSEYRRRGWI